MVVVTGHAWIPYNKTGKQFTFGRCNNLLLIEFFSINVLCTMVSMFIANPVGLHRPNWLNKPQDYETVPWLELMFQSAI